MTGGLQSGGLQSLGAYSWGPTISGYRFWSCWPTQSTGAYILWGLQSWATAFGATGPFNRLLTYSCLGNMLGGLWVRKVRERTIRVDWAEFRIIWSRRNIRKPTSTFSDLFTSFCLGSWQSFSSCCADLVMLMSACAFAFTEHNIKSIIFEAYIITCTSLVQYRALFTTCAFYCMQASVPNLA